MAFFWFLPEMFANAADRGITFPAFYAVVIAQAASNPLD
jgi:hypothetical protein